MRNYIIKIHTTFSYWISLDINGTIILINVIYQVCKCSDFHSHSNGDWWNLKFIFLVKCAKLIHNKTSWLSYKMNKRLKDNN